MIMIQPLVCGAYQENAYVVYDDARRDLLIIDPGDDLPAIEQAIAAAGRALTDILLTHGHFDHALAVAPLREKYGARVHIHPLDGHLLSSPGDAVMNEAVSRLPFVPLTADALYPMDERFGLSACGLAFEGLHTPGHTAGGVCLMLPDAKALFTGDTLFAYGYGRYDLPGGDPDALRQSLRTVLLLPRDCTVYPGHGEADTMKHIAARWRMN